MTWLLLLTTLSVFRGLVWEWNELNRSAGASLAWRKLGRWLCYGLLGMENVVCLVVVVAGLVTAAAAEKC